jgi:hypothetical protein
MGACASALTLPWGSAERFGAPLRDAVAGAPGGRALERLVVRTGNGLFAANGTSLHQTGPVPSYQR